MNKIFLSKIIYISVLSTLSIFNAAYADFSPESEARLAIAHAVVSGEVSVTDNGATIERAEIRDEGQSFRLPNENQLFFVPQAIEDRYRQFRVFVGPNRSDSQRLVFDVLGESGRISQSDIITTGPSDQPETLQMISYGRGVNVLQNNVGDMYSRIVSTYEVVASSARIQLRLVSVIEKRLLDEGSGSVIAYPTWVRIYKAP